MLYITKKDMISITRIRCQIGGIKLFDYNTRKINEANSE